MDKSKVLLIAIMALLVVLIVSIIGGSFFILKTIQSNQEPEEKPFSVSDAPPVLKASQIKTFSIGDAFSTNLKTAPNDKPHAIKITISLGIKYIDPKVSDPFITLLSDNTTMIQDKVLSIIRSKTNVDFIENEQGIKTEILYALQELFESDLIYDVYVSNVAIG